MKHQVDFLELLQIDYEKYPVIAVVGGGGKTSLIYRLTDELIDKGKRVIITTTTHMAGESELPFARGGDAVRVKELLDKERYVIAAEYEEDTGKYASLTEEKLEELRELCDVMLVEADGAKHHPVKVPEKWEPVIPRCADIVISVIGLDCLGQPISQSAYRMERTSEFLRKSLEAPITEEDIVKIATSICGLFKDVEERVYRVYLNKSDILREKEPAEHIVEELERKNTVAAYGSLLEIAMIMLAAGNSRRFGANKLLYEIDGIPMYRHVLEQLDDTKKKIENIYSEYSDITEDNNNDNNSDIVQLNNLYRNNITAKIICNIIVITQYDAIAEAVKTKEIQVLYNPHPEDGISSSVKIGLNASLDADAVLFTVSDQPWLTSETICELIHVFLNTSKGIACVSCQGKMGNPCIFDRKYYNELLSLEGDKGGKKVIMKHLDDTQVYEIEEGRELEDIDYYETYNNPRK